MDPIESKPAFTPEPTDVQQQVESLRQLIISVLILVIMISGAFNIYLLRQWKWTHADLAGARPQIAAFVNLYQNGDGPNIEMFFKRILDYAQTHPDFVPILTKYGIRLPAPTTTTGPAPALGAPRPITTPTAPLTPSGTQPATDKSPATKNKK